MLMNKTLEKDIYQKLPRAMPYPRPLPHSPGVQRISENPHLRPLGWPRPLTALHPCCWAGPRI